MTHKEDYPELGEGSCPEEMNYHLPAKPGVYVVQFHLQAPVLLTIGSLGTHELAPGEYFYVGSACGPGGLRARLGRHLHGSGKLHWHIDYLRKVSTVVGYSFRILVQEQGKLSRQQMGMNPECRWGQALCRWQGAQVPVFGFGASDCRAGCKAHLVYFSEAIPMDLDRLTKV